MWSHRRAFDADVGSVCHAREFVGSHLTDHGQPELVDDVALVMSELATNAVVHARTPFSVTIQAFDESLLLLVSDESPTSLSPAASGPLDLGGRGLMIVEALTTAWGVTARQGAKSVWARFPRSGVL